METGCALGRGEASSGPSVEPVVVGEEEEEEEGCVPSTEPTMVGEEVGEEEEDCVPSTEPAMVGEEVGEEEEADWGSSLSSSLTTCCFPAPAAGVPCCCASGC